MASRESAALLKAFLRHPVQTGAIMPSSSNLARSMVRGLRVRPGRTVVELGPGTGSLTAAIVDILPSEDAYVGIELVPDLVRMMRTRFPGLRVVEGSAGRTDEFLATIDAPPVAAVIAGLPFATLPPRVMDEIVDALDRVVGRGAEIRTFQYVHAWALPNAIRFRRRMSEVFGPWSRLATVWQNVPPAFVLRWSR